MVISEFLGLVVENGFYFATLGVHRIGCDIG
jgi:hypothetical protein